MLNQETKRKIDTVRDILVGKIPDPKAQVEQITTAMIYKFMDDMDKTAQELGGRARFFTNGFQKYAWSKVMDQKLGGDERVELYAEAITKMSKNPHIPQLFRDVFVDAFLPYRSPETLKMFLKEMDGFTYDHSEDLGDGFEYLLSIMGSQGDAGQFRTPRHIIDFIVQVVNPKKDDTILDPACGTAGFLISAYKHILAQHDGKNDPKHKEKGLTPDDKKRLARNLVGYDISPEMVRLSKVNMYLHKFSDPKIYEYDTLSSEEKWDDKYDVILANPPFMTPRGGIRPHTRFSVQANRAEVLFVDYIMEHLRPEGRAGIIVPEGIIFKSDNAYKELRKLLIEDGLFAVASLPAGVFNPYAAVKTSILFFDNALAKVAKNLLFVNITNDGFDLGAQRSPIAGGQLASVTAFIHGYQYHLRKGDLKKARAWGGSASEYSSLVIDKKKIAENGDYRLSADFYRKNTNNTHKKWPMLELGEVCTFEYGKPLKEEKRHGGEYPVFGSNGIVGYHDKFIVKGPFIVVGRKGTAGAVVYSEKNGFPIDTTFFVKLRDKERVNLKYLYLVLRTLGLDKGNRQSGVPGLNRNDAYKIKIPLPSIEVQKEIVEQVEVKQNAINHAKAIIENLERERRYFGQSLRKLNDIEWVELGEVCEINPKKSQISGLAPNIEVSFIPMADVSENSMRVDARQLKRLSEVSGSYTYFADNDVLLAKVTPCFENGKGGIVMNLKNGIGFGSSEFIVLRASERILPELIYGIISSDDFRESGKSQMTGTGGLQRVPPDFVKKFKIPLPSAKAQKQIVEEIKQEEEMIGANRRLIEVMEEKISKTLSTI